MTTQELIQSVKILAMDEINDDIQERIKSLDWDLEKTNIDFVSDTLIRYDRNINCENAKIENLIESIKYININVSNIEKYLTQNVLDNLEDQFPDNVTDNYQFGIWSYTIICDDGTTIKKTFVDDRFQ